jgi:hypothetical protein
MLNVSVIVPSAADSPFAIIHLFRDITHQWRYETYVNQIRSGARRLLPPQATLGHHPSRRSTPQAPLTPREACQKSDEIRSADLLWLGLFFAWG